MNQRSLAIKVLDIGNQDTVVCLDHNPTYFINALASVGANPKRVVYVSTNPKKLDDARELHLSKLAHVQATFLEAGVLDASVISTNPQESKLGLDRVEHIKVFTCLLQPGKDTVDKDESFDVDVVKRELKKAGASLPTTLTNNLMHDGTRRLVASTILASTQGSSAVFLAWVTAREEVEDPSSLSLRKALFGLGMVRRLFCLPGSNSIENFEHVSTLVEIAGQTHGYDVDASVQVIDVRPSASKRDDASDDEDLILSQKAELITVGRLDTLGFPLWFGQHNHYFPYVYGYRASVRMLNVQANDTVVCSCDDNLYLLDALLNEGVRPKKVLYVSDGKDFKQTFEHQIGRDGLFGSYAVELFEGSLFDLVETDAQQNLPLLPRTNLKVIAGPGEHNPNSYIDADVSQLKDVLTSQFAAAGLPQLGTAVSNILNRDSQSTKALPSKLRGPEMWLIVTSLLSARRGSAGVCLFSDPKVIDGPACLELRGAVYESGMCKRVALLPYTTFASYSQNIKSIVELGRPDEGAPDVRVINGFGQGVIGNYQPLIDVPIDKLLSNKTTTFTVHDANRLDYPLSGQEVSSLLQSKRYERVALENLDITNDDTLVCIDLDDPEFPYALRQLPSDQRPREVVYIGSEESYLDSMLRAHEGLFDPKTSRNEGFVAARMILARVYDEQVIGAGVLPTDHVKVLSRIKGYSYRGRPSAQRDDNVSDALVNSGYEWVREYDDVASTLSTQEGAHLLIAAILAARPKSKGVVWTQDNDTPTRNAGFRQLCGDLFVRGAITGLTVLDSSSTPMAWMRLQTKDIILIDLEGPKNRRSKFVTLKDRRTGTVAQTSTHQVPLSILENEDYAFTSRYVDVFLSSKKTDGEGMTALKELAQIIQGPILKPSDDTADTDAGTSDYALLSWAALTKVVSTGASPKASEVLGKSLDAESVATLAARKREDEPTKLERLTIRPGDIIIPRVVRNLESIKAVLIAEEFDDCDTKVISSQSTLVIRPRDGVNPLSLQLAFNAACRSGAINTLMGTSMMAISTKRLGLLPLSLENEDLGDELTSEMKKQADVIKQLEEQLEAARKRLDDLEQQHARLLDGTRPHETTD